MIGTELYQQSIAQHSTAQHSIGYDSQNSTWAWKGIDLLVVIWRTNEMKASMSSVEVVGTYVTPTE